MSAVLRLLGRVGGLAWVFVVLLSVVTPVPVAADAFGTQPGGPGFVADGRDHWFCFVNISAADRRPFRDAMQYLDARVARVYDVESSACGNSTDVAYWVDNNIVDNLGFPARGRTWCRVLFWGVCDQFWVSVNPTEIIANSMVNAPGDWNNVVVNYNKTIRHETGHSMGLQHSGTVLDAMRSGWVDNNFFYWYGYNDDHRDHLRDNY